VKTRGLDFRGYGESQLDERYRGMIGGTTMSTGIMTQRITETSPRLKARITGMFHLFTILTGIFAQGFVSGRLVVDGDATATATNILTHRPCFSGVSQSTSSKWLAESL
jgi:hypothetical protein